MQNGYKKGMNQLISLHIVHFIGKMIKIILFGLIAASAVSISDAQLVCKDEKGNDVDWFMVYKIPYQNTKEFADKDPLNTGFSYAYMTGKPLKGVSMTQKGKGPDFSGNWTLSTKLATDTTSIFAVTLDPLYKTPKRYTHVMYNDAPPHDYGKIDKKLTVSKNL